MDILVLPVLPNSREKSLRPIHCFEHQAITVVLEEPKPGH